MYYVKKESYTFNIPQEYRAYLEFKTELRESGITFLEEGGSAHQEIVIFTRGTFDKSKEAMDADG